MRRLSAVARALARRLEALGRVRIGLADVRRAFLSAAPDAVGAPDQRERLAAALDDLAAASRILLPAGPRSWDRAADPPLPRSVRLSGATRRRDRAPPPAETYPWRPELSFAAGLRLDESAFDALRKVNDWLRDRVGPRPTVPARERSLQVFGDEKAIDRLARTTLFGPGRLGYALLDCEPLSPPFVWSPVGDGPDLLVVENHDTFHSLKTVLAGRSTTVGFVAYGAGKAFARSVTHAVALPRPVGRILYFGDLDAPGLRIPIRASRRGRRSGLPLVEPADHLYDLLLEIGRPAPYPWPPSGDEAEVLVRWLPQPLREGARDVLLSGRRIAQEWVGLEALTDRAWRDP